MDDFDRIPDVDGLRKGLKSAGFILLVGLAAWGLIFLTLWGVGFLVWGW